MIFNTKEHNKEFEALNPLITFPKFHLKFILKESFNVRNL